MKKKVLLVRDDNFFIYLHQVAILLKDAGHDVHLVFTTSKPVENLYQFLVREVEINGVRCDQVLDEPSKLELTWRRMKNKIYSRHSLLMSEFKIRRTKQFVDPDAYDVVIAFDPAALWLATNVFSKQLKKVINFSLEVIEESHPRFHLDSEFRKLLQHEREILPKIGGLLIQDRFREELLLNRVVGYDRTNTIYYPVAVSGPKIVKQHSRDDHVVLFYGGIWSQEFIDKLRMAASQLGNRFRIIVKGGRGRSEIDSYSDANFVLDRSPIPFAELDKAIADADIGIAIYPDIDKNSRTTAFSSEKIARYTKCGLPFVAFDSPDYQYLKSVHDCCVLIDDYDQLPRAIHAIADRYEEFRKHAYDAFDEFYCLEKTARCFLKAVDDWE